MSTLIEQALERGQVDVVINSVAYRLNVSDLISTGKVKPYAGTSYTFRISDCGSIIETSSSSAVSFVVPPSAQTRFPQGATITVQQGGTGQASFVAAAGVMIKTPETLDLAKQEATASIICIDPDNDIWRVSGYLAAA